MSSPFNVVKKTAKAAQVADQKLNSRYLEPPTVGQMEANRGFNPDAIALLGDVDSDWLPYGDTNALYFYFIQATVKPDTVPIQWPFICAPQNVSHSKSMSLQIAETWATKDQTVIYGGTSMRKFNLDGVLLEGLSLRKNIDTYLAQLEALLDPVQFEKFIAPIVFQLIIRPRNSTQSRQEKSLGYFLVESINITHVARDNRGQLVRAEASISLQEVPKYQVNTGRDLSMSDNLNVTYLEPVESPSDSNSTDGMLPGDTNSAEVGSIWQGGQVIKAGTTVGGITLDAEQAQIAELIIEEGRRLGATRRQQAQALASALQESTLRNLQTPSSDGHGSFGVMQEVSQFFGKPAPGIEGARQQIRNFYTGRVDRNGYRTPGILDRPDTGFGETIQAIQQSAHPTLYSRHEGTATAIVNLYDSQGTPQSTAPQRVRQ